MNPTPSPDAESRPTLSILLPAYNEAAGIARVVAGALRVARAGDEVLVVDDGSTDDTAREAHRAGARVVRIERNGGKGLAVRRGLREAHGEVIVLLDADEQDDPSEIPLLLEALTPGVDMVIGSRFLGTFESGAITRLNRIGTVGLTAVMNRLYGTHITDPIAGFRAVRADVARAVPLRAARYDIEMDLLLGLLNADRRVVEVGVRRASRRHGATSLSPLFDGTRILATIVRRWLER